MNICQNYLSKDFETQKRDFPKDFRDFRTQSIRTSDNQSRDEITSEIGTHPSKMRTRSRLVSQLAETLAGLNIAPGTGLLMDDDHPQFCLVVVVCCCTIIEKVINQQGTTIENVINQQGFRALLDWN
jgi:hypothetical protein